MTTLAQAREEVAAFESGASTNHLTYYAAKDIVDAYEEGERGRAGWEAYEARNITAYAAENQRLRLALMAARSWIGAQDYGKVLETSALTARADALAAIDLALKAPAHD